MSETLNPDQIKAGFEKRFQTLTDRSIALKQPGFAGDKDREKNELKAAAADMRAALHFLAAVDVPAMEARIAALEAEIDKDATHEELSSFIKRVITEIQTLRSLAASATTQAEKDIIRVSATNLQHEITAQVEQIEMDDPLEDKPETPKRKQNLVNLILRVTDIESKLGPGTEMTASTDLDKITVIKLREENALLPNNIEDLRPGQTKDIALPDQVKEMLDYVGEIMQKKASAGGFPATIADLNVQINELKKRVKAVKDLVFPLENGPYAKNPHKLAIINFLTEKYYDPTDAVLTQLTNKKIEIENLEKQTNIDAIKRAHPELNTLDFVLTMLDRRMPDINAGEDPRPVLESLVQRLAAVKTLISSGVIAAPAAGVKEYLDSLVANGEAKVKELQQLLFQAWLNKVNGGPGAEARFVNLNVLLGKPSPDKGEATDELLASLDKAFEAVVLPNGPVIPISPIVRNPSNPADIIFPTPEIQTDYEGYLNTTLRKKVADKKKRLAETRNKPLAERSVSTLNLEEVVELLSEQFMGGEKANQLKNRFLVLLGGEENEKRKSWDRVRIALQAISVAGDSGGKDFGIWYDAIIPSLLGNTTTYVDLARGLFIKAPSSESGVKVEAKELDDPEKSPIDTRPIMMWDYAIKRIKGPRFGGYGPDYVTYHEGKPDVEATDDDFSYQSLVEDKIPIFKRHLQIKFADFYRDDPQLFEEMFKYIQVMAGKSVGYVPFLAHEVTRAHGNMLKSAGGDGKPFSDELFVAAPFAADFYNRGRYAFSKADATAEDLEFMPERVAKMLTSEVTPKGKEVGAVQLWKIVDEYRMLIWGETPGWVMDVRKMIDKGTQPSKSKDEADAEPPKSPAEIDAELAVTYENVLNTVLAVDSLNINETWFPLAGEVVPNILKVEEAKRQLAERIRTGRATEADRADFISRCKKLGYGDKWDRIGIPQLSTTEPAQYKFAYDAVGKMFSTFQEAPKDLSEHAAIEEFTNWMSQIIGKAKLTPGKHHLLFGPMTLRMMHRIVHSYDNRADRSDINALVKAMLRELEFAGGVPEAVREYAHHYVREEHKDSRGVVVQKQLIPNTFRELADGVQRGQYAGHLWMFKQGRERDDLSAQVSKALPLGMGKKTPEGLPVQVVAPWAYKHVDKDTGHK